MPSKKTAPAEQSAMPQKIEEPITGARIIAMPTGTGSTPALIYKGSDIPKAGTKLLAKMDNGTTYSGIVADATEADGEVLVEFRDGLTPE